MSIKDLVRYFRKEKKTASPAKLELIQRVNPGRYVSVDYLVTWRAAGGSLRLPEEHEKQSFPCNDFVAGGKHYSSPEQLCTEKLQEDGTYRDVYGRDVFGYKERFPCFDSYDYLYEHRYFRWFYIREGDSLCCVYYEDERDSVEVTEDVSCIHKERAWKAMKEISWQG